MNDLWRVNLSSWIIQDGNYDDFAVGDEREFALEFWPEAIELSEAKPTQAIWVKDSHYEVVADIVFRNEGLWVLDFGLSVFRESKPMAGLETGDRVAGGIGLGVDPFFYFEYLHELPDMRPLIYTWTIERIWVQTAPFIEATLPGIGKALVRDESKWGYREIRKTDAWKDDGGNGDYLLECRLHPVLPKKTRRKAT